MNVGKLMGSHGDTLWTEEERKRNSQKGSVQITGRPRLVRIVRSRLGTPGGRPRQTEGISQSDTNCQEASPDEKIP